MSKLNFKFLRVVVMCFMTTNSFSQTITQFVGPSAGLVHISSLAFDRNGNLYATNHFINGTVSISKITPDGSVSTFVPPASGLISPLAMVFDNSNNLYVADSWTDEIFKITPGASISAFVSSLNHPTGLAIDNAGNLFVSNDAPPFSIDKVAPDGTVSTFCVTNLNYPGQIAIDQSNNIYVANAVNGSNSFISKITSSGNSSVLTNYANLGGLAVNMFGNIYVSQQGPAPQNIIILKPDGTYNNTVPFNFDAPSNFTFDASNNLFVGDYLDSTISKIIQATLPLTLPNLNATFLNNNVQIKWNADIETNTDKFIIQHSIDGKIFYDIGEVKAISSGANYYNFTDDHQYINGTNYYRLKTIDIDNRFTISKVITLDIKKKNFTITPNPATNFITLKFIGAVTSNAEIIIFNSAGKKMIQTAFKSNTNEYQVNIQSLRAGTYIIEINLSNTKCIQKLIVKK